MQLIILVKSSFVLASVIASLFRMMFYTSPYQPYHFALIYDISFPHLRLITPQ